MSRIRKQLGRLYFLHIFAILAVWLSMYIPGLDFLFAIIYILLIIVEGKESVVSLGASQTLIAALLWQLPGLVLAALVMQSLSYNAIFLLEIWVTPLIPVISLAPALFTHAYSITYYQGYYGALLAIILLYLFPLITKIWKHK